MIPTEPIGSIPRPLALIEGIQAFSAGKISRAELDNLYDAALRDTIERFEATGSPQSTDRACVLTIKSTIQDSKNVLITVEDSGSGIKPENVRRIFDSFFTTKPHGMGMGLAICRSIIDSHGGSLSALQGQPHGTVFQVTLPTGID